MRARATIAVREILGVDLRSLALLRIGLAVCVLLDLAGRVGDLRAHYTDAGVLSRADALELYGFLHAWPLCVHLAGGSTWSAALFFALAAAAAGALLVGYHTRAATALSWLLATSVQLRNPYIGAGWDALLRLLLLWGVFLPLGARWSLDADDEAPENDSLLSAGSIALLAQMAIVYASAGATKLQEPAWRDGTALVAIFADDFGATALGKGVAGIAWLARDLTRLVPPLELAGAALLFAPLLRGPLRTLAIGVLAAMTAVFGLCLSVGLFPAVALVGLAGLLPAWFWQRSSVARWVARPLDRAAARLRQRWPVVRAAWWRPRAEAVAQGACAIIAAWVVFWSIGVVQSPVYRAPEAIAWLGESLFLQQDWRMFSVPPSQTGWIEVRGRLRDGTPIDLLATGGPAPRGAQPPPPETEPGSDTDRGVRITSGPFKSIRWRLLLWRATDPGRTDQRLLHYGRYLCREWNAAHFDTQSLTSFTIVFAVRPIASRPPGPVERRVLWSHDCFG